MAAKKDIFIQLIPQIELDGGKNIPTCLYYKDSDTLLFGNAAKEACPDPFLLNQDFKVDLGRHDSTRPGQNTRFQTASGVSKSAAILAADFIDAVLMQVDQWLAARDIDTAAHILLAEPLAMHAEDDAAWLTNYRRNLTELLRNRQHAKMPHIRFEKVDFLPEPFAVFQYYRYGIRHPLMVQSTKHQSLILDFGGGTFDVCIVETTKQGDISQTGRNSKPLGASSEPVGGYEINRQLARHLFKLHLLEGGKKDQFKKGIELYTKWRLNEASLEAARPDSRNFAVNFHRTALELEDAKLALCRAITTWDLDAPLSQCTNVRLPADPFVENPASKSVQLSATELRAIFSEEIWDRRLKSVVSRTFERAALDMEGQPITIVLLSGGSANIGWLRLLLFRDFCQKLSEAETVQLPDYQEVVSKGLAVECARRFYTTEGDFGSVTYNRLCLMLDVNRTEEHSDCRPREFKPITAGLPPPDSPGVLLPSASTMEGLLDQPLQWKVRKLGASPKHLDYYFLRASLNPEDLDNRLNFEETHVDAPSRASFDQDLKLELTLREDGTAIPRFIYKAGHNGDDCIDKICKPFALDMTCTATAAANGKQAYVGFDFGTSNSSVSYVDNASVSIYQARKSEASWLELNEIAYDLPHPAADPLLRYLGCSNLDKEISHTARETLEGIFATAAYCAYADYRQWRAAALCRDKTFLLKSLPQRSLGPLWNMLRTMFGSKGISFTGNATFSAPLAELFSDELVGGLNDAVNMMGEQKHEKRGDFDCHRPLYVAANILRKTFKNNYFGFFEQMEQDPFSDEYKGFFRVAHGNPPFIRALPVKLARPVPNRMPYLLDAKFCRAIPLKPLFLWMQIPGQHSLAHGYCFLYDLPSRDDSTVTYKAVGQPYAHNLKPTDPLGPMVGEIKSLRQEDGPMDSIQLTQIELKEEE